MTTYTTELRLRELGIRLALGADAPRVAKAMFADLWWIVPLGVGVGLLAAGLLTSFLNQMYGNPMSAVPFVTLKPGPTIAATLTLVVIAVAGTAMPLRRVLTLDIMRTIQRGGAA
jgi:ABC-type antimicrobial peptide transport system permease subunit